MKIEMEKGEEESTKKKSKMAATKNFSLLSFGEEAEEDEMDVEKVREDIFEGGQKKDCGE